MKKSLDVVKLERISDGQYFEKSLQNWNALPRAQKEKYRVVGGDEKVASPASSKPTAEVPEEVKNLRKKNLLSVEGGGEENTQTSSEPAKDENKPEATAAEATANEPNTESDDDKTAKAIVAEYDTLKGTHEERRKVLANKFSIHWRKVETILSNEGKK